MKYGCFKIALAALLSFVLVQGVHAQKSDEKDVVTKIDPETELAIDKALEYLGKSQKADGSWGDGNKVARTALALMAFMAKGHMPEQEPYGDQMSKGIDYLLKESKSGRGYMGRVMYEHGFATLALSEVWGMTSRDKEVRQALKRGVDVIIRAQSTHGAWWYGPQGGTGHGDISVTVVQCVALASAKEAGIFVPDETIDKAMTFVKYCQVKSNGGFGYVGPGAPGYARTAAGCAALSLCGQRDYPGFQQGIKWMQANVEEQKFWSYGRYYATIAMLHSGDEDYQKFYKPVHDKLMAAQNRNGSWVDHDAGMYMAILILGTPYRFIPIYQR